jgi:hypothetical protein
MVEILQSARPGVLVAYLCLGLGLVLILVALRDWSVRREQRARRREVLEKVMVNNAAPTAAEVDVVWGDALKNLESLQHQLKGDIEGLEHKLEVEREQVQAKTDALKNLARQNRVRALRGHAPLCPEITRGSEGGPGMAQQGWHSAD